MRVVALCGEFDQYIDEPVQMLPVTLHYCRNGLQTSIKRLCIPRRTLWRYTNVVILLLLLLLLLYINYHHQLHQTRHISLLFITTGEGTDSTGPSYIKLLNRSGQNSNFSCIVPTLMDELCGNNTYNSPILM